MNIKIGAWTRLIFADHTALSHIDDDSTKRCPRVTHGSENTL